MNLAVVGAGGWGRNLVRVFAGLEGCVLRAVCDLNPKVLAAQQKLLPSVLVTSDLSALLADPGIDALVVAADAGAHHPIAKAALLAGKHVFVEKPLTLDVAQAHELTMLARAHHRKLMVGHLLVYHPAMSVIKELCRQGELGDIYYLYSQRLNLGIIRSNENAWWSLAPHDIALALWLLDRSPSSVVAVGASYLQTNKGIEDVVFASLGFPDGQMAQIHVSWLDPQKMRKLTIVGSKKMLVFDDTQADEKIRIYDKGAAPEPGYTSYEAGVAVRNGDIRIPNLTMREPLLLECSEFRDCIVENRDPRTPGEAGLEVVRVLDAGARSLHQGGTRVEIAPL
ncbi:MAG TPA: Gfo/Idh/MocA family oxidoreductase [Polyangia bacterium]